MTDAGRAPTNRSRHDGYNQGVAAAQRFADTIAAIEAEAAQRAIDELLTVERVAADLHTTFEDFCLDPELGHDMPDDWWTKKAAALIAELRR